MLTTLVSQPFGGALVALIAVGLAGYALWPLTEAAFGIAGHGTQTAFRLQSLVRGIVYIFLVRTSLSVLRDSRTSWVRQQLHVVGGYVHEASGRLLVGVVDVSIVIAAAALARDGWKHKFMQCRCEDF